MNTLFKTTTLILTTLILNNFTFAQNKWDV